jgi:hypothetical protein
MRSFSDVLIKMASRTDRVINALAQHPCARFSRRRCIERRLQLCGSLRHTRLEFLATALECCPNACLILHIGRRATPADNPALDPYRRGAALEPAVDVVGGPANPVLHGEFAHRVARCPRRHRCGPVIGMDSVQPNRCRISATFFVSVARKQLSISDLVIGMTRKTSVVLYIVDLIAIVVSVDFLFFRNRIRERLLVNIGIVLVFVAFYLRFLKNL